MVALPGWDRGTKNIAGGKMAHSQPLAKQFRLRALSYPRRTQQLKPPGIIALWGKHRTPGCRTT